MKLMANHSSARAHEETPHESQTTTHISKAVRRRAEAIVNDRTIDAESRALIRFALEINDPVVAELVRRANAGERLSDTLDFPQTPERSDDDSSISNVEALTAIICGAGEKASAALLVLMAMLQASTNPKALANTAKHLAFTRCGELNIDGMVDAQAAIFNNKLFAMRMDVS
jgi:hypothetical protein